MNKDTLQDLGEIVNLFQSNGYKAKQQNFGNTMWVPTPLGVLIPEMGFFDSLGGGAILVAGSGDGRDVAALNRLGYDVMGIEIDRGLYDHSVRMLQDLNRRGLVDLGSARIINGDFLDERTYSGSGERLGAFPRVTGYLSKSGLESLGEKIRKESPKGTELIVLGVEELPLDLKGFELLASARIETPIHRYLIKRYEKS